MKKNYFSFLKSKIAIVTIMLLVNFQISAQTYVTSGSSLTTQVNAAAAGAIFIIPNGTYNNFSSTFTANANAANPITIKAETVGGVTLTGDSKFVFNQASHIVLEGFVFNCTSNNTLVKLNGSNNIRVTRNVFDQVSTSSVKMLYIGGIYNDYTFQFLSHDNRIDHNIFQNKTTAGNYLTIDGTSNADGSISLQSQNDKIDYNYFKNMGPREANEKEAVRIGWSQMSMSSGYTILEHNLFEDCDGDPEVVSVKSCDNIIRHNTFTKSYGTLSLRHGNRSRVEGNYFFGGNKANGTFGTSTLYTGGIRIYGKDHLIINNYFEGLKGTQWDAPITLTQGDAIDGSSTNLTKHFRAENVTIAYNTLVNNKYGIEIGFDNNNNYNTALKNIKFANNIITGSENNLINYIENQTQGSEITWFNNVMNPTGTASLTSNASTFTTAQAQIINPNLTLDGTIWKATSTTPLLANGISTLTVSDDIQGQTRPATSNPGADHFSTDTVIYGPLSPSDVGPNAYNGGGPSNFIYASSVTNFIALGETKTATITSNVNWTATTTTSWISISPASGSLNGSINITAAANPTTAQRNGTVTLTDGTISTTINIIQLAGDPTTGLNMINDGTATDPVTVTFSTQQVDATNSNYATNTLDKLFSTRWSGYDIGAYLIYDLGSSYNMDLVRIATTSGKTYLYEILTSNTGNAAADFASVSNVQSNSTGQFEAYPVTNTARYVKIIGNGQAGGVSLWNTIIEIELYGTSVLSTNQNQLISSVQLYPNPAKGILNLSLSNTSASQIQIFTLDGRQVISQKVNSLVNEQSIDVSALSNGSYLLKLSDKNKTITSKMFLIAN